MDVIILKSYEINYRLNFFGYKSRVFYVTIFQKCVRDKDTNKKEIKILIKEI